MIYMLCAKFGWNWSSGSGEYFSYVVGVFSLICYYPHDPSFKQTWNPFIQECFVPCLIEIVWMVLQIFKSWLCILNITIWLLFLFGGRCMPFIWIIFIFTKGFMPCLIKIGPDSGSGEKAKNVKSLQTKMDRWMTHIRKVHLKFCPNELKN